MTTMAKMFVGLNLVLACSAFGAAAALLGAQDAYKSKLEEITTKDFDEITRLKQRVSETNKEVEHQKDKTSEATREASKAEGEKVTLQAEMNKATEINDQLRPRAGAALRTRRACWK